MERETVVAAAQLGPAGPTRADTVGRIADLIRQAGSAGVELVVFPELALSPYFAAEVHADLSPFVHAEMPGEETAPVFEAVQQAGLTAVLPYAELVGSTLYNSSVVIGPAGQILGHYRKSHIPGKLEPEGDGSLTIMEKRYFAPGDLGFPLYPTAAGPLGIGICYDRRFPELYRCYALQGGEVVACCFNTPVMTDRGETIETTREAQELAVRGGAIANCLTVIASGKAGVEGGVRYSGGSCVIDFKGRLLAMAGTDGDELVAATIDREAAAEARQRLDLEANRRPELYTLLTAAPVLAP